MAKFITMSAEVRERAGKGAARATRRAGRVPAVIYGNKQDPVLISLEPINLHKQIHQRGFFSHLFEIEADGKKHKVLPRDLQLDPVTGKPLHVDFMRFGANTRVTIDVPMVFVNEEASPGIKKGGVLNVVRHTVEMACSPEVMPESIDVDLAGYEIGASIHISAVTLPDGVVPTITDRDFTIATIAAPTVATAESDEAEAEGEGETEGEDKSEE